MPPCVGSWLPSLQAVCCAKLEEEDLEGPRLHFLKHTHKKQQQDILIACMCLTGLPIVAKMAQILSQTFFVAILFFETGSNSVA